MKSLFIPENPRLIVFKMKINRNSLPGGIEFHRPEKTARTPRESKMKGKQIASGRHCDLSALINGLTRSYVLVDAFYTNMDNGYVCAHFVFSAEQFAEVAVRVLRYRLEFHSYLRRLLSRTVWVTDAYVNPFIQLGKVVPQSCSLSVNCRNFTMSAGKEAECVLEFEGRHSAAPPATMELATA